MGRPPGWLRLVKTQFQLLVPGSQLIYGDDCVVSDEASAAPYTLGELMVASAAREIRDGEVVFVGMRLPLIAFVVAKKTHAPECRWTV